MPPPVAALVLLSPLAIATPTASSYALDKTIRRAEFWDRNTATLKDVINVMGRWESANQWKERSEFSTVTNARKTGEEQGQTEQRYQMAKKLGMCERVAMQQNVPKLPFNNEKLAQSVGLTCDDFNSLPVSIAAVNIVFDALAQSKAGLIPPDVIDKRRNDYLAEDGSLNELAFSSGLYKSRSLVILSWFFFGKGNFLGFLVLTKIIIDSLGVGGDLLQKIIANQELILLALGTGFVMQYVGDAQDRAQESETVEQN